MSKTLVVTSGDVNFNVASHLSNLPTRDTEAFTENLIVLFIGVISTSGTSARLSDGNATIARRQSTTGLIMRSMSVTHDIVNFSVQGKRRPVATKNNKINGRSRGASPKALRRKARRSRRTPE